jgi:hypothetical protein
VEIPDHIDGLRRQGGLGAAMRMLGEKPGQDADVSALPANLGEEDSLGPERILRVLPDR